MAVDYVRFTKNLNGQGEVDAGTSVVDGTGNWSKTLTGLASGNYEFSVFAVDEAGNESGKVSTFARLGYSVTPSCEFVGTDGGIQGDALTNDPTPQFRATLTLPEPETGQGVNRLSVAKFRFGYYPHGSTIADMVAFGETDVIGGSGTNFEATGIPSNLPSGTYYFHSSWQDSQGTWSAWSDAPFKLDIDLEAPNTPVIDPNDKLLVIQGSAITISGTATDQ